MSRKMPQKIKEQLAKDIHKLQMIDENTEKHWDSLKDRRLTFEEIGKLIRAGVEDIDIIYSCNTKSYWLYSNTLDAYCDMDYQGWKQEEEFIKKLVENREYLFPLMGWMFGEIDL